MLAPLLNHGKFSTGWPNWWQKNFLSKAIWRNCSLINNQSWVAETFNSRTFLVNVIKLWHYKPIWYGYTLLISIIIVIILVILELSTTLIGSHWLSILKKNCKAMMDRDQQDNLPSMQIGFIDSICLPLYKVIFLKINYAINNNCAHLKKKSIILGLYEQKQNNRLCQNLFRGWNQSTIRV